jgi:hypothetical protein
VKQLLRVAPIAVMIALVVPAMVPSVAEAMTVDQQRTKVENIVDELERLEEMANAIAEDYVEAIGTKEILDLEIIELEADIVVKEGELNELRADLGDMAVRSFVGSGVTPLGPLFEDSADINDVLQRDELARVALSAGDVSTDELDAFVVALEDDRETLQNKVGEAQSLAESLVNAQSDTERLTGEYETARISAEAELGQLIAQEEARRAAESLARVQAEFQAAQNAAASNNSGGQHSGCHSQSDTNTFCTPTLFTSWGGSECGARPAGRAVPVRDVESRRVVRLFGSHRLRLGAGRRVFAAPVPGPGRFDPLRVARQRSAG